MFLNIFIIKIYSIINIIVLVLYLECQYFYINLVKIEIVNCISLWTEWIPLSRPLNFSSPF
jgi:hypothetical protein